MRRLVASASFVALAALTAGATAQTTPREGQSAAKDEGGAIAPYASPIVGSTLLFDQSMTTQTARLDTSPQQSYVPLYQWWLSFRPRWHFTEELSLRVRADYYKEITNAEQTTYYREDVFGDIWTDLVYSRALAGAGRAGHNTKITFGPRALWPTSKVSQANGTYVTLGATGGVSQKIPIAGDQAPWLESARAGLTLAYAHPFSTATTPTSYGNFAYVRQDAEGFSFASDQVRGATLVNHQIVVIVDAGLQITPKLGIVADMIGIDQWHYLPAGQATVPISGGSTAVARGSNDTQFTQQTWFLATLEYALLDEVALGLGYYNLANAIAPDGQRRGIFGSDNVWWSPDARVFFDVTANLDKIYGDVRGRKADLRQPARDARVRGVAR